MNRLHCVALVVLLAPATPVAQTPLLPGTGKSQKDGTVEFSSRSGIPGTMAGRVSTHFSPARWAGLKNATSFVFRVQDEKTITSEILQFEVRGQDPASGFPDWLVNPGGPLLSVSLAGPGYDLGGQSFEYTITPAVPLRLSGADAFYLVWRLPANAAWPADGLSVHVGSGIPHPCDQPGFPACCGGPGRGGWEQPRPGVIERLSPADSLSGGIEFPLTDDTHFHWIRFDTPVLQALASNPTVFCPENQPNTGHAAMDPDVSDIIGRGRNDDLGWRVRAGPGFANGVALVYCAIHALPTPYVVPGVGDIWIDPRDALFNPLLVQGPIALDAQGVGDFIWQLGPPASPLRQALAGNCTLHSQALVITAGATSVAFTNMDTFRLPMVWGRWVRVTAATPHALSMAGFTNIRVGNEGPGDLMVDFHDGDPRQGGTRVLGTLLVRERTTGSTETDQFGGRVPTGTAFAQLTTRNQDPYGNNSTRVFYVEIR